MKPYAETNHPTNRRNRWATPEPRGLALETALAEARNRHARLLTNAGHAMVSDALVAMEGLISRGEK